MLTAATRRAALFLAPLSGLQGGFSIPFTSLKMKKREENKTGVLCLYEAEGVEGAEWLPRGLPSSRTLRRKGRAGAPCNDPNPSLSSSSHRYHCPGSEWAGSLGSSGVGDMGGLCNPSASPAHLLCILSASSADPLCTPCAPPVHPLYALCIPCASLEHPLCVTYSSPLHPNHNPSAPPAHPLCIPCLLLCCALTTTRHSVS